MMKTLRQKLQTALEIPFDPTDEGTSRTAVITGLLNIAMVVALIYVVPFTVVRGFSSAQSHIVWIALFFLIVFRFLIYIGHAQAVSLILLLLIWLTTVYEFIVFENGLRAPAYAAALAFVITYAGLLHGRKAAWILAGGSVLVNILVIWGELNGFYLTEPRIPDARWAVFGQVIFFSGITYMLNKTLQNLNKSISLYRTESENRLQAEINVRKLNDDLNTAYETTLQGWAQALELRDKETEGHSRRVVDLSISLARELGFKEDDLKYVRYGALLHDIGKMGVPDEILNKPGQLTEDEWLIVRKHPKYAVDMLKEITYLQPAISIPYAHHENWDGTGYPLGLQGDDIPFPARIFAVVDNWDALISDRPYRKAWSHQETAQYIQEQSGYKFDPDVVALFLPIINSVDLSLRD